MKRLVLPPLYAAAAVLLIADFLYCIACSDDTKTGEFVERLLARLQRGIEWAES